jgi:hypothetical protein
MRTNYKKSLSCPPARRGPPYLFTFLFRDFSLIPTEVLDLGSCAESLFLLHHLELPPVSRLEPIATLFANGFPFTLVPGILSDNALFAVIRLVLSEEDADAVHLAVQCLDTMFGGAEHEVAQFLFHRIFVRGILRRVIGRFRFLRRSTHCLATCFSFAEKLLRLNQDENFAHGVIWGLGGGIFHCMADLAWTDAPPELWSVLGVLCVFRSDKIYRLMRFVGSQLQPQIKEFDWARDGALEFLGVEIIGMFTGLLDLVRPEWLASADISCLLIRILRTTSDVELAHASLRLLADLAKLQEGLIPPEIASISVKVFNSGPGFVEDAVEMVYAVFLDAPDDDDWFSCAIWALGFGEDPPEDDISWEAKLFYTVCISVCSQTDQGCPLPRAVDFLPLLCLLLTSGIPEPAFVRLLLELLLQYAGICVDDHDAAACFIEVVGDPYTGDALTKYLQNGYDQVRIVWEALHDLSDQYFSLGWGMEFPEQ